MADLFKGGQLTMYNDRMQIFGLGSQLDVKAILDAELEVLKLRQLPYENQKKMLATEKEVWNSFKSALSSFSSVSEKLKNLSIEAKKVSFGQEGFATATASTGAIDSNYSLSIQRLATRHRLMSDQMGVAPLGYDGTVQVNGKDLQITSDMGLKEIATAINKGNYGADAVVLDGRLVMTSKLSGSDNSISFTDTTGANRVFSTDSTKVFAKITGAVDTGSKTYSVEVSQLASAHKVQSGVVMDKTADLNFNGDFTINGKTVSITASDSLEDVSNKINNAGANVLSSIDSTGRLVLESKETGSAKAISIADNTTNGSAPLFESIGLMAGSSFSNEVVAGNDAMYTVNDGTGTASYTSSTNVGVGAINGVDLQLKEVTSSPVTITVEGATSSIWESIGVLSGGSIKNQMETPQDAQYTINGISMTSSSNTVTDIDGVSITLLKETASDVSMTVNQSNEAVKEALKEFVKVFNSIVMNINKLTAKEGAMQGETVLNQIKRKMTDVLMSKTDSNLYMFNMGIKIDRDAKDGTIKFDETVYSNILRDSPQEILKLISGENAIGDKMFDMLNDYTKATGTIANKVKGIDDRVVRLDDNLTRLNEQFERQKQSLLKKYAMLEITLSGLNVQADYMKSQMQALLGTGNNG